jgi:phosphoribosylamine--glycine ligase / phosphoribosylformylglycinamidine cyclo-ligase
VNLYTNRPSDDYDLAGFAVGAVRRSQLLPKFSEIKEGDVLIGLPSTGLHSNGFSLVRKIIEREGLEFKGPCPWDTNSSTKSPSLAHALLTPTALYVKPLLPVLQRGLVKALSHITGGGFIENLPRALPPDGSLGCVVDVSLWELPGVFRWLMKSGGGVDAMEMCRVWNCGIGMVLVVGEENVESLVSLVNGAVKIGWVKAGRGVEIRGLGTWSQ